METKFFELSDVMIIKEHLGNLGSFWYYRQAIPPLSDGCQFKAAVSN